MKYTIFDIETNGLLNSVSQIHCLSFQIYNDSHFVTKGTITDIEKIKDFFAVQECLVGHNIINYDLEVLKKLLNITTNISLIDTLGLSFYLYPEQKRHGLEYWGDELGVKKPYIEDWKNQSLQDYVHRCETDVEINSLLFLKFMYYLREIYNNDMNKINEIIDYLNFKLDSLREQEYIGITLDKNKVDEGLKELIPQLEEKTKLLSSKMPATLGKIIKKKPKIMFKADKTLSANGKKWLEALKEYNSPYDAEEIREEPNPGSDKQLKDWLFLLGWKPITFKESKATKEKIPQVSLPMGGGICSSVKELYTVEPVLKELEGYYTIKHRIGILKSFLENEYNGKIYASAQGFSKTLRMKHSVPCVNLPKPSVFFGETIRSCLTVPNDDYIMIGADISGLEDNTKQHYIYFYDPKYVTEMRVPGFDPHVDIGVLAGLISKEEETLFKRIEATSEEDMHNISKEDLQKYKSIKKRRGIAKTANFAATYGAGGPKIAATAKISLDEGNALHSIYWKRNWAIKKVADTAITKEITLTKKIKVKGYDTRENEDGSIEQIVVEKLKEISYKQKWIKNPLSGFWLFLSSDKDRFSAINQSSGVFVFDNWLRNMRKELNPLGIYICLQYHDEVLLYCKKEYKSVVTNILNRAMKKVNEKLSLNVEIKISIEYGKNYAECH